MQMGMIRKVMRWRILIFKTCSQHTTMCCIMLTASLMLLLYVNISQSPLHEQLHRDSTLSSQKQSAFRRRRKDRNDCKISSLRHNSKWIPSWSGEDIGCRRITPVPGSCHVADQLFFSDLSASCSHQQAFNFCHLKGPSDGEWTVFCNETEGSACDSALSVGTVDQQSGSLTWEEVGTPLQVSEKLNAVFLNASHTKFSRHYGFCFIRCIRKLTVQQFEASSVRFVYGNDHISYDNDGWSEEAVYAEQLLILPPKLAVSDIQSKSSVKNGNINVNMMLVDSVSHQHFFRSLPKSVSVLENINLKSNSGSVVLDFQLVQAVRSRTFETLQTIFSGVIDSSQKPFGTQDIPPQPLQLSSLLKTFKDRNYYTLWLEDLCYLWEWGISKDLHFLNKSSSAQDTWIRMWKRLSQNRVDSVDVTLAMCKVLETNNVADHFHGPDAVCFNGRHQHEYLLEYLLLYQQTMDHNKHPYFTFTMTNVAHEGTGRRVQTLDEALARYLKMSSSLPNTITILFSDHGNAYGKFIEASLEARVELFHPCLFLIIPNSVARVLGDQIMQSLGINSQRLVSFHDLHYSLRYIADPDGSIRGRKWHESPKGLFEPVSVGRTCDDIPRIMPNLCICQNFDTPIVNDTSENIFAYFAIGRLNDKIQRERLSSQSWSASLKSGRDENISFAFGNCEILSLDGVQNVRRSFSQGSVQILKMDLLVQQSQIFFVAVRVEHYPHRPSYHKTVLEMYDRITPYSKFSVCADDIDLTLCICNTTKQKMSPVTVPQVENFMNRSLLPQFEMIVQNLNSGGDCILLVTVRHESGAVMFSANKCKDKSFSLSVSLEADTRIIYASPSKQTHVMPGGMMLVGFVYSEDGASWTCSLKIACDVVS